MAHAAAVQKMTGSDFLNWDATQTLRHEFVDGEVFAMAGASETHVTLALNIAMALRVHLAGTACRTFITDMKLHVQVSDKYFYPDVMVTCNAADAADPLVKREPVLLVEVLSPATEGFDRGAKFAAYRSLDSLREYLLIDPNTRRAELYRKGEDGLWVLHAGDKNEGVVLASVDLNISAQKLWAELPAV